MAAYRVTMAKSAEKELLSLDPPLVRRIFSKIQALGDHPRPSGCKKLVGGTGEWRIRIGDYRVIYTIDDSERIVDISGVRHRRDAYD
jgi:mRNA interferase RelE/StbE